MLAMDKGKSGEKYIFSTRFVEVDELMRIMERVTGRPRPALRLSPTVMSAFAHVSQLRAHPVLPLGPQRFTPFAVRFLQLRAPRRHQQGAARARLSARLDEDAVREAFEHFVARGRSTGSPRRRGARSPSPGRRPPPPTPAAASAQA